MSVPISRRAYTAETSYGTPCLNGNEMTDVNSADSSQSTPLMSKEVTRHIRAVTDPLSKQL